MAAKVKTKCSECGFEFPRTLTPDEKEIICLTCGRRMANLTDDEIGEIEGLQKKQRTMSIIALVCLFFAVVCLIMWVGETQSWISTATAQEPSAGMFAGAIVMGLATIVFSIMASLKRVVVEF